MIARTRRINMNSNERFSFRINGQEVTVSGDPTRPLADYIRDDAQLTGTKIGCSSGECGACTVILDGIPVTSCLIPVASVADREVVTVEGLSEQEDFKKLAAAMEEQGAVQCGFCTPGFMTTLYALKQNHHLFEKEDISAALKNNLCRCTGYRGILAAAEKVVYGEGSE
jgi:aerobic-type carbon monoxide dehydrogenase small subunit (CoxS/CutS family)